jgi:hypothetical protein
VPDERYGGGTFDFNSGRSGGGAFSRLSRAFGGGAAQASLKFDIPGLQQFKREIGDITTGLKALREEFDKLPGAQGLRPS